MEDDPNNNLTNKTSSVNIVDSTGTGIPLNYKNTQGSSQYSNGNAIGKIFYKKVKLRKMHKKLKGKPTVHQTNEMFDDLINHLEKNNGNDNDLVSCLR